MHDLPNILKKRENGKEMLFQCILWGEIAMYLCEQQIFWSPFANTQQAMHHSWRKRSSAQTENSPPRMRAYSWAILHIMLSALFLHI